jgi:hypothetical protein
LGGFFPFKDHIMPRQANPQTDFTVDVEGIGRFTFGRRRMRDELDIQREFADIIGGVQPTPWLEAVGGWISALKVLTVRAPDGWDLEDMDPLESQTYTRLNRVYQALREKEGSFRGGSGQAGAASSS